MRRRNFIVCGLTGWCIEIFFTAITSKDFKGKHSKKLEGHSSIWMFPIYGIAALIGDIYPKIAKWPKLARAFLYGVCFLMVEFISGSLLTRMGVCPWCYDGCRFSVNGVIRLDFFPLWMIAGMLYEHILRKGPLGPFLT
jgi:uncharacterized membrane protein